MLLGMIFYLSILLGFAELVHTCRLMFPFFFFFLPDLEIFRPGFPQIAVSIRVLTRPTLLGFRDQVHSGWCGSRPKTFRTHIFLPVPGNCVGWFTFCPMVCAALPREALLALSPLLSFFVPSHQVFFFFFKFSLFSGHWYDGVGF